MGKIIIRNRRHLLKTKEGDAYFSAQHQHKMGLVDDSDQNILVENDKNNLIEDNGQSIHTGTKISNS